MKMVIIVLNQIELLEDILTGFLEIGVSGATIMDSVGMGRVLSRDVPIFAGLRQAFPGSSPTNKTIMVAAEDRMVENIVSVMEEVCGDLSKPGIGLIFVLPLDGITGMAPGVLQQSVRSKSHRGAMLAKDLMLPLRDYATIREDFTVKDALVELWRSQHALSSGRHYHRAVLVLDSEGSVVGKLTHKAVLKSLQTDLLSDAKLGDLTRSGVPEAYIRILEQNKSEDVLTRICSLTARMKVTDIKVPFEESVDENEPIIDVIEHFTNTDSKSLLVMRLGKVIGILRKSDVFQEVSDIIRSC